MLASAPGWQFLTMTEACLLRSGIAYWYFFIYFTFYPLNFNRIKKKIIRSCQSCLSILQISVKWMQEAICTAGILNKFLKILWGNILTRSMLKETADCLL